MKEMLNGSTMKPRVLINADNDEFESLIPQNKNKRAIYFEKIKAAKRKKAIIKKKSIFKKIASLSYFDRKKYIWHTKTMIKNKQIKNISFQAKYRYEKSKYIISYILEKAKHRKERMKTLRTSFRAFNAQRKNKSENKLERKKSRIEVKKLKFDYKNHKSFLKQERSLKNISKKGLKTELNNAKMLFKGDKMVEHSKKIVSTKRNDLIYTFHQNRQQKKLEKKLLKSKLGFLAASIPTDLRSSWRKYVSPIAEFIFPSLGSLINKEYFKALLLFVGSLVIYGIALGFATGFFHVRINGVVQGGGILGLITLGANSNSFQPDSRFYLIFGILAVLFIALAFIYSSIFSRIAYKKSVAYYSGYRSSGAITVKKYLQSAGFPYIIATPLYLIVMITTIFPLLVSFIIVFTNYGMDGHKAPVDLITWVGIDNLREIFTTSNTQGKYFLKTLEWSFIWGIGATLTSIAAGISLALLVNHPRMKGKKIIRVLFMLPIAVPFFIMALYFRIFFGPTGSMNHDVTTAFMPWVTTSPREIAPGINQTFADLPWFSEVERLKGLLFVINIWFGFSGMFLFITGLLQGIPNDLYEAAEIDGAPSYKRFSKITSPIILYQIAPLLIGAFIGGFNNFGLIYLFTEGGPQLSIGGPGETDILASYVFKLVRDEGKPALASTYMFVIAILFGVIGLAGFSRTKTFRKGNY